MGYNLHNSIIKLSAFDAISIASRPGKLFPCLTLTKRISFEIIRDFSQFAMPNDNLYKRVI